MAGAFIWGDAMGLSEIVVLALAGFFAGVLNAVAGGGTFISFPALVWAGIPPISANATASFAALPGYISSTLAYWQDVRREPLLGRFLIASVLGGLAGAGLLLVTSQAVFMAVVPWLLLLATLAFALAPVVLPRLRQSGHRMGAVAAIGVIFLVCVYGGYFNGGLGIMLLAAFSVIGLQDLHQMNGLKNLMSAVLCAASVVAFILSGLIDWPALLVVGCCSAIGGYLGAGLAKRLRNPAGLRIFIVAVGAMMTLNFFWQ